MEYVAEFLVFATFALSLNLLLGYAGQVSVAHAAFGAVGGYVFAAGTMTAGLPSGVALVGAPIFAGLLGLLVGLPALRLSEEYLILLTLAVQTIVVTFLNASPDFGGPYGLPVSGVELFGVPLVQPIDFLPWFLALAGLVAVVCWRVGESPFGRVLKGIRQDPELTRSLGKRVYRSKLVVFTLAAACAGIAGTMLVLLNSIATPQLFSFDQSVAILAMVVIGGRANALGAALGAALIVLLEPFLELVLQLPPQQASFVRSIVFGLLLVVVVLVRPQGLIPERKRGGVRNRDAEAAVAGPGGAVRRLSGGASAEAPGRPSSDDPPSGAAPIVEVSGLTKSFGGIRAARDLDFSLYAGRVTALIGPNGAGKSTVFGLLTGQVAADAGSVRLRGDELVGLPTDEIARRGMVRSFQHVRLINRLSAVENVMLAVPGQKGEKFGDLWLPGRRVSRSEIRVREEALRWLDYVGMAEHAVTPAGSLSFGDQKLLSLARILASGADVILLDEPASGIEGALLDRVLKLVRQVAHDGRAVCIVEHNLDLVRQIADDVLFLELGEITARGSYEDLINDPRLSEAYFGTQ